MYVSGLGMPKCSFKGNYYYETDSHGNILEEAQVLTQMDRNIKGNPNTEIPDCFIHGGDFVSTKIAAKSLSMLYSNWAKNHKNMPMYFAIGSSEMKPSSIDSKSYNITQTILSELKDFANVHFLSAINTVPPYKTSKLEPYAVFKDKVEDKNGNLIEKKVVIIATTTDGSQNGNIKDQKEGLRKLQNIAEKSDNIILISHNKDDDTQALVNFIKEDLKIKNVSLVLGAHTHATKKEANYNGIPAIYPCVNGTCGVKIKSTVDKGFDVPEIPANPKNSYDYYYSTDKEFPNVYRSNTDVYQNNGEIDKNKINEEYLASFLSDTDVSKIVGQNVKKLPEYRDETNKVMSKNCEYGTLICNEMKKATNSDMAILFSMTFKNPLMPHKNDDGTYDIRMYDIRKTFGDDHNVAVIKNVTTQELIDVFKHSYENRNAGFKNRNFLEFSDNVKVDVDNETGEIKQIYVKVNNKNNKLLDDKGQPIDENRIFSVATCSYLAQNAKNRGFHTLADHKFEIKEDIKLSDCVANYYTTH